MTVVLRAPMRSRDDTVDHAAAVEHALATGLVGVGGRLTDRPVDLDAAVRAVDVEHGERVAARLQRFADEGAGTLAWTRDEAGALWLGRITGPWHFDESDEAFRHDLQHVRPCRWTSEPVPDHDVPDGVVAAFARGGRNLQRIRGVAAEDRSAMCAEDLGI